MGGWGELLTQAIIQWYANRGRNGDTPNQYPVDLPPEVKRVFDEAWNVYKSGGSPIEKDIRSIGTQFLGGMPTTATDFKFISPELAGQKFAGGVTLPKIDVTKLPSYTGNTPPPSTNVPPPNTKDDPPLTIGSVPNLTPERRLQLSRDIMIAGKDMHRAADTELGGSGGDRITVGDSPITPDFGTNPITNYPKHPTAPPPPGGGSRGTQPPPSSSAPPPGQGGVPQPYDPSVMQKVRDAWDRWRQDHPNWAKLGVGAATTAIGAALGIGGSAAGQYLRNILLTPQLPVQRNTLPQGPGTLPEPKL